MRLSCCPPSVAYWHLDDAFPPVLRRRRALAPVRDLDAEFVAEPSTTPEQVDDDAVGLAMCEVEKNGRMYEHAADVARGRNGSHRGRPPERGLVFWRPDPYALGLESGYWRALAGSASAAGSCERERIPSLR